MRCKKGFTLVELLVVIIIVGILAGTMMLAYGNVVAKAEAAKVVNTMKLMKSSATFLYNDTGSWTVSNTSRDAETWIPSSTPNVNAVKRAWATLRLYSDTVTHGKDAAKFMIEGGTSSSTTWVNVRYNVGTSPETYALRKALEKMAASGVPIMRNTTTESNYATPRPYKVTDTNAYLFVGRYP